MTLPRRSPTCCVRCGTPRTEADYRSSALGMCRRCYRGTTQGRRTHQYGADVLEDWAALAVTGLSRRDAAARIGISYEALCAHIQRTRRAA